MDRARDFFEQAMLAAQAGTFGIDQPDIDPGFSRDMPGGNDVDPLFSRAMPGPERDVDPFFSAPPSINAPSFALPATPQNVPALLPGASPFQAPVLGGSLDWGLFSNPAANSFLKTPTPLSLAGAPGWGLFTNPNANTFLNPKAATGATGSGASAVAAARPSPAQATTPTYGGVAPPGAKSTVLRWLPMAQAAAQKYNVPVELVLAVMHNESSGDPNAQSPWNPGQGYAKGLMQVMPFHFKEGENPFDPATNIDKGVKFLGAMYNQFGRDPEKAMAAYFGGPGAIDAAGNIRRGIGDVNITVGKYLDTRLKPALATYTAYMQGQAAPGLTEQAAPQASQGAADLADLWAWLGGSRQQVTGNFGAKDGPYPGSGHRGMDIGAPEGTRLVSPIEGVVMAAGDVGGGYGNQVRIKTAYGSILLGHLASVAVQQGQRVTPGMALGVTGNTGRSTGAHLHFELRDQQDNAIDPARYYRW
jgi:hypothetical protein